MGFVGCFFFLNCFFLAEFFMWAYFVGGLFPRTTGLTVGGVWLHNDK